LRWNLFAVRYFSVLLWSTLDISVYIITWHISELDQYKQVSSPHFYSLSLIVAAAVETCIYPFYGLLLLASSYNFH